VSDNHLRKRVRDFLGCYIPLPYYYGRNFRRIFKFLLTSQHWPRDQMAQYKLDCLRALLRHAESHVPYYKRLFKSEGISSSDIGSFEDYARLPILTKDLLDQNLDQMKANNFASFKPILTRTSGTTGRTTTLYRSSYQESFRLAALWRHLSQHGFGFGERRVTLMPPKSYSDESPLYYHDRIENTRVINSYHILAGKKHEVLDAIREFQPRFIWTSPNLLYVLAEYLIDHRLEPVSVPLIEVFGEKLYDYLVPSIRKAFPGEIIDYYANRENSIAAWGNGDGVFTEVSEYCHLEPLAARETDNAKSGSDLITTNLHNYACPLIRYNSEDVVRWIGFRDDAQLPSLELLGGRGKDLLLTDDGLCTLFPFSIIRMNNFEGIRRCQVEQVTMRELVLRLVTGQGYDRDRYEAKLVRLFEEALLNRFAVRVEYVDEADANSMGKFRPVISRFATEYIMR
jgi:phenylacetate-CoA ligase